MKKIFVLLISLFFLKISFAITNGNLAVAIDTMSASKGLFLATANDLKIYSSHNLVNWTPSEVTVPKTIKSMAVNESGTYVAVGLGGEVFHSDNGFNWQKSNSGINANLYGVVAHGNQFVAVGDMAMITSKDGIHWTKIDANTGFLTGITVSKSGKFVAVSPSGMIYTSNDIYNWHRTYIGNTSPNAITVNQNGTFIAVGKMSFTGNVLISKDGEIWSPKIVGNNTINGVTVNDNMFVAVGDNGFIFVSADGGENWVKANSGTKATLHGINYSQDYGLFIAFDQGSGSNNIIVSSDGYNWSSYKLFTKITEFSINGYNGVIDGDKITIRPNIRLPLDSLVAKFNFIGYVVDITVNSLLQKSEETKNDFSNIVNYTVRAADGSTKNYAVIVILPPEDITSMTEYAINGYRGTFTGNNILVTLPKGTNLLQQKATFNGNNLFVNGKLQSSNKTENDFTNPVKYELRYSNGKEVAKEYTVTVNLVDSALVSSSDMRENKFNFSLGTGIESLNVVYKNSLVTDGERANVNLDSNKMENNKLRSIIFNSSRKKSKPVADSFNNNLSGSGDNMMHTGYSLESKPKELNFYIRATLEINGSPVSNDVYIAQGSSSPGINNWWIGTLSTFSSTTCGFQLITMDGSKYYITSNGRYELIVSKVDVDVDGCVTTSTPPSASPPH